MAREKTRGGIRWRLWLTTVGWCLIFVSTAVAARKVYRYVSTDPQFSLSREKRDALTVQGAVFTSRKRVMEIFAPDFGRSVFQIPIAERRRLLLAVDWVEDASVSRVWPDRILVRITERKPVAFVNLPVWGRSTVSRIALIDSDGVLLDQPSHAKFNFPVLSGITEGQSEQDRRVRVHAMMRLLNELGPLAANISEINATSTEDLIVVAQVDGRAVELVMGDSNYRKRFENFVNHFSEIRSHSGNITKFDLRLDDRIMAEE